MYMIEITINYNYKCFLLFFFLKTNDLYKSLLSSIDLKYYLERNPYFYYNNCVVCLENVIQGQVLLRKL